MNDLPPFDYHRPSTLAEACALLAEPGAVALAGGTDLMVHMRAGRRAPATVPSRPRRTSRFRPARSRGSAPREPSRRAVRGVRTRGTGPRRLGRNRNRTPVGFA